VAQPLVTTPQLRYGRLLWSTRFIEFTGLVTLSGSDCGATTGDDTTRVGLSGRRKNNTVSTSAEQQLAENHQKGLRHHLHVSHGYQTARTRVVELKRYSDVRMYVYFVLYLASLKVCIKMRDGMVSFLYSTVDQSVVHDVIGYVHTQLGEANRNCDLYFQSGCTVRDRMDDASL